MASLITAAEKTTLNNVMDDQHDTFARAVTIYKDAVETVSTQSSSFNSIYGNAGATTPITYTPQSETVQARIQYGTDFSEDYFTSSKSPNQIKVYIPEGLVRMKIKSSDLSALQEAKRIEFDSQKFSIYGDFRGHGLFDSQFYTVMLKKIT
jgi:hypothetical protein|tara:strand:+ start:10584 stop:11036 length:453 start_codon:yes stop_codon:yes gene_type:complete